MEKLLQFFTPETYNLHLEISRETESINGKVLLTGWPHAEFTKLHAVNLKIKNISVRKFDEKSEHLHDKKLLEFSPCDFTYENNEITIKNSYYTKNSSEQYLLQYEIIFETKLNQNLQGCYLSKYTYENKTQKLVTTQFESHYARECFPCIDEPAAKARFYLSITVPDLAKSDVVLANTEVQSIENRNKFIFQPTPRMSTYLLAWVIGPLQSVSTVNNHGIKVTTYAALNQTSSSLEFANEVAARALDYYDKKFGVKYPLSKLDQVALPDFEAGAMENWGLVTYRESCMLAEPNASIDSKQSVAITVTHELSHQWFGDLVTMQWWDDLWLNESFATIMEYYATDALYPEFNAWQDFYTGDCVAALRRDCLPGVQAVQQAVHHPAEIATLFDAAIVYAKGARLVLMLLRTMGEENFYHGMHDYFVKYQFSNTAGDDLWNCLQKYAQFNVKDFMHAWISQPGYPVLWREGNQDEYSQTRFLINGETDNTQWPIPEVQDNMSGHYLIDLNEKDFTRQLEIYDTLSAEQKLRLLIDRMLLAKTPRVSSDSLLDLLPKFTNEDATIWDILLSIINDLKMFFVDDSAEEDLYRQFLRQIIHQRVREIGVLPEANDNSDRKRLRKILAVVARFSRDQEIINALADLYQDNLSQLDSEMRGNILMAKMLTSESEIYDSLFQKYQTENDPDLKEDLLCTIANAKQPEHIQQNLSLLNQPEIVRPQDHIFLYIYLLHNPKSRTRALGWLYSNWNLVVKITGEKSIEDYPRIAAGYINNRTDAKEFYQFFDPLQDDPILKRTLAMAKASIETKLELIERESTAVHQKLQNITQDLKNDA